MKKSTVNVVDEEIYDFKAKLAQNKLSLPPITIDTLWANISYKCNQACVHCHVAASPRRTEEMSLYTMDQCLYVLSCYEGLKNLDITGGAPELNENFNYFVVEARKLGKHVIVRHNFTVTADGDASTGRKMVYLPDFFAENEVEIIASLPHYEQVRADEIRGIGVFQKSIEALRSLNKIGYGQSNSGLVLNLVYNHDGPLLPTERDELEMRFSEELMFGYGLCFNKLLCVSNMPINRFQERLQQQDTYKDYMDKLESAFSPAATKQLVCRSLISVGYDGRLYDCDFNQVLDMQITVSEPLTIFNFDLNTLLSREIRFGSHCFGCTAGGGSS